MTTAIMIAGGAALAFTFGFLLGHWVGVDDGYSDARDWYERKRKAGM